MRDYRELYGKAGSSQSGYPRRTAAAHRAAREQERRGQQRKKDITLALCLLVFTWLLLAWNLLGVFQLRAEVGRIHDRLRGMGQPVGDGSVWISDPLSGQEQSQSSMPEYYAQGGDGARQPEIDYVSLCGLEEVCRPVKRSGEEVLECLRELSEENDVIAEIYKNRYSYPDKMLEALANNPEMADFVRGYLSAEKKASGGLTDGEKDQDFPLFLQWDPRWGYAQYGDGSNIGLSGCGPTCLSMALYYLTGNEELTPDKIAQYSMDNGYYVPGSGTAWALLQDVPKLYGLEVSQPKATEWTLKNAIDQGKVIICSMSPGDFTAAGHFIVIYGYDREGFLVNDPNCVARSRKSWSFQSLGRQIKNTWILGQ